MSCFLSLIKILIVMSLTRFSNEKLSAAYAKFRPTYSPRVMDIILSYMARERASTQLFDVAVDVACGTGQSTFLLHNSFKKIVGLDISETQIEQAKKKQTENDYKNVEFVVGDAHDIPMESSSVDLLTCAMAWHWLDAEKFYAEAKRVLKQEGCIAVYGHGSGARVFDNTRIKTAFDTLYAEFFKCDCFAEQNLHVLNNYEAVELPFSNTRRVDLEFPQEATIDELLGFFSSISMYLAYCKKYPNNTLLQQIRANYEEDSERSEVEKFTFPGFVILGQN